MDEIIRSLTQLLSKNIALDATQFNILLSTIDCKFPSDYIEFMKEKNGGEGIIGEGRYVQFWLLEELLEANADYMVHEFAPDLFLIGSDGGGTAFGVKRNEGIFIEVPFVGMSNDEAIERGKGFKEFLSFLSNQ